MTQVMDARKGIVTEDMLAVSEKENRTPEFIRQGVAEGRIVIPKNKGRSFSPEGIGKGLKTKINANIGTSGADGDLEKERQKLFAAVDAGADSVMDLSTGGDLNKARRMMLENSKVMIGAVPIYAVAAKLAINGDGIEKMTTDMLFESIEAQCAEGVDYITVHTGITRRNVAGTYPKDRLAGVVSRGGSLTASWMKTHGRENPLYEYFDRLLDIAFAHDVTLSLGDGLRPGAVADATDHAQIEELLEIGRQVKRAREKGVQVMVEGPGHMPLNQIQGNVMLQKRICDEAPFYVLGPLTTDIAPGYDHITAAVGGAVAAWAGADFLCYVTPAEHLALPDMDEVREGVIAAKIAAHSGDIAKGVPGAVERDNQMSAYRKALNWEGMYKTAIDPEKAKKRRAVSTCEDQTACTMCGKLCAMEIHSAMTEKS